MSGGHLYKHGAKRAQERKFQERYGKEKGKRIYGAVVGKVYREQHGHTWNRGEHYKERGYGHTEQHEHKTHDPPKRREHHERRPEIGIPVAFTDGHHWGFEPTRRKKGRRGDGIWGW